MEELMDESEKELYDVYWLGSLVLNVPLKLLKLLKLEKLLLAVFPIAKKGTSGVLVYNNKAYITVEEIKKERYPDQTLFVKLESIRRKMIDAQKAVKNFKYLFICTGLECLKTKNPILYFMGLFLKKKIDLLKNEVIRKRIEKTNTFSSSLDKIDQTKADTNANIQDNKIFLRLKSILLNIFLKLNISKSSILCKRINTSVVKKRHFFKVKGCVCHIRKVLGLFIGFGNG